MKVEGIIFDLDGTLAHTIEDLGDAANILFRRHGYPEHTTADFIRWIGSGAKKFIEQGVGSVINTDHLNDYVREFKEIYAENLTKKSHLYPGVPEMLNAIQQRDIKTAVLSNKPHHLTLGVVENLLSDWKFEPVFGQREAVPRKPDPAAAIEIAGMMNISPGKLLFIGDSAGDIKTAQAAGMIPIGVHWGYGTLDDDCRPGVTCIDHPTDILNLL